VGALDRGLPVSAAAAVVAALSMVGVPPAGGFFSKWYVLRGAVEAGEPVLAAAVLGGSLLAAIYMYRFTEHVWFGKPGPPGAGREAPPVVLGSLALLALGVVAAGLASVPLVTGLLAPAAVGR
jgi:multicomponent Na+:H+ antiporter subunit D